MSPSYSVSSSMETMHVKLVTFTGFDLKARQTGYQCFAIPS